MGYTLSLRGRHGAWAAAPTVAWAKLVAWLLLVWADQERKIRLEMRLTCNCHGGPPEPYFTS